MCTVVCRWDPANAFPVQIMALRDELKSRTFDPPGRWWVDLPTVVGGRDHRAGGTWCASEVLTGSTAVLINRPDHPTAAPGAASRGVIPLLAARYAAEWTHHLTLTGMAGFHLVLAAPDALTVWSYDGRHLSSEVLCPGTHKVTPFGRPAAFEPRLADGRTDTTRALSGAGADEVWPDWLGVIRGCTPDAVRSGLLVRLPRGDDSFETVFGQLIAARPGHLRIDHQTPPHSDEPWETHMYEHPPVTALATEPWA